MERTPLTASATNVNVCDQNSSRKGPVRNAVSNRRGTYPMPVCAVDCAFATARDRWRTLSVPTADMNVSSELRPEADSDCRGTHEHERVSTAKLRAARAIREMPNPGFDYRIGHERQRAAHTREHAGHTNDAGVEEQQEQTSDHRLGGIGRLT